MSGMLNGHVKLKYRKHSIEYLRIKMTKKIIVYEVLALTVNLVGLQIYVF